MYIYIYNIYREMLVCLCIFWSIFRYWQRQGDGSSSDSREALAKLRCADRALIPGDIVRRFECAGDTIDFITILQYLYTLVYQLYIILYDFYGFQLIFGGLNMLDFSIAVVDVANAGSSCEANCCEDQQDPSQVLHRWTRCS